MDAKQIRVGVNGYGVIGQRVADAVTPPGRHWVSPRLSSGATDEPVVHVAGSDVVHPALAAVRARHAEFARIGFKGAEEPSGQEAN